jgi:hypothetical protein
MADKNERVGKRPEDYAEHGLGAHETAGQGVVRDEDQAARNRPLPASQRSPDDKDLHRPETSSPETPTSIGQQG